MIALSRIELNREGEAPAEPTTKSPLMFSSAGASFSRRINVQITSRVLAQREGEAPAESTTKSPLMFSSAGASFSRRINVQITSRVLAQREGEAPAEPTYKKPLVFWLGRSLALPFLRCNSLEVRNLRAFTLIELLVTLAIVSILAAATLPAFKNVIVERKTSVAALEVKAFLEAARARAIARGRPVSVILERLSSRTDGYGVDSALPISIANPARSITAENPPYPLPSTWTPADPAANFDTYNACIRMVMAESMRPTEFEFAPTFLSETDPSVPVVVPPLNDGDPVVELGRILRIPNLDARLAINMRVGNEIEVIASNDQTYRFLITNVVPFPNGATPSAYYLNIRNEGNTTRLFGSAVDIDRMAQDQTLVRSFSYIGTGIIGFRIVAAPRPIASTSVDLPKGTCIDLSLSGLASDDPAVNPPVATPTPFSTLRDCRREFASDWISGSVPIIPMPHQLRPVYLTFSPSGSLANVYTNAPSLPSLRRIDPHADVCLFVGRTGQFVRALTKFDIQAAFANSFTPNLMDKGGFWVRISPSSNTISSAPALVTAIDQMPATTLIGDLLTLSRQGTYVREQTAQ